MGEESAQKTSCKSYRKNGSTVPYGGGVKKHCEPQKKSSMNQLTIRNKQFYSS